MKDRLMHGINKVAGISPKIISTSVFNGLATLIDGYMTVAHSIAILSTWGGITVTPTGQ
jgi:hypothetical protein